MYQDPSRIQAVIRDLRDHGLGLDSEDLREKAAHYLARIGERRLLEYTRVFRKGYEPNGRFVPGFDFHHVRNLYKFDHWLRLHMLDALERIEISIKSDLHHELTARYGEPWLLSRRFLDDFRYGEGRNLQGKEIKQNEKTLDGIKLDVCRKPNDNEKDLHRDRLFEKRLRENPFRAVNGMMFGNMSKLFAGTPREVQDRVAANYDIKKGYLLAKILWPLNTIRNSSAHHEKLWDIYLDTGVTIPDQVRASLGKYDPPRNFERKIYGVCLILYFTLQKIARHTEWHKRLRKLVETGEEKVAPLKLSRLMGFPPSWKGTPLWQWDDLPRLVQLSDSIASSAQIEKVDD